MIESFAVDIELWHLVVVFLAALIGESYGAIVGGGSVVTLPALLYLGLPIQSAIAVDNAASLGTEVGILSKTKKKVLDNKKIVLLMSIPITVGGVIGAWLLLNIPGDIIKYLMVATIVLILIDSHYGKEPDSRHISNARYELVIVFLLLIGIYSNFISAGEGAFSRFGLMMILGWTFIQSQGIKAAATIPSRIYLIVVTAFAGLIVWPYLLTMWCATFIAGRYATGYAMKVPDMHMKTFLTIISIVFVIYLLFFY